MSKQKGGIELAILISAIKIIFLLGFLVLIHEGGHFLVAKMCKVKVNEFAIGFGKILLQKQGKDTKYSLPSTTPAGLPTVPTGLKTRIFPRR